MNDILKAQLLQESEASLAQEQDNKRKARNQRKSAKMKQKESVDEHLKAVNKAKKARRNTKLKNKKRAK